jgi:uncharacterized protein with PIN domain
MEPKFIVDHNVGKLARWLRMMGYDTLLFKGADDSEMVKTALKQNRIVLTKDTHIQERRIVTSGKVKLVLVRGDDPEDQLQQAAGILNLDFEYKPFSLCLECNRALEEKTRDEVCGRVPPYVYKTQTHYMECPSCHRIYWRGSHWQEMSNNIGKFVAARSKT